MYSLHTQCSEMGGFAPLFVFTQFCHFESPVPHQKLSQSHTQANVNVVPMHERADKQAT